MRGYIKNIISYHKVSFLGGCERGEQGLELERVNLLVETAEIKMSQSYV